MFNYTLQRTILDLNDSDDIDFFPDRDKYFAELEIYKSNQDKDNLNELKPLRRNFTVLPITNEDTHGLQKAKRLKDEANSFKLYYLEG